MEASTAVSLEDRLVRFAPVRITDTNFGSLPKEQVQDIVTAIDRGIPDEERVIALDRVLASIDRSQIIPRNVEGVKADPPAIFFGTRPAILVGFDGEPVWSPIKDNDAEVCGQHQLGRVPARTVADVLSAERASVAEGERHQGTMDARGHAARQLREASGRRELERRESVAAGRCSQPKSDAGGARQHGAERADSADRCTRRTHPSRARSCFG